MNEGWSEVCSSPVTEERADGLEFLRHSPPANVHRNLHRARAKQAAELKLCVSGPPLQGAMRKLPCLKVDVDPRSAVVQILVPAGPKQAPLLQTVV